MLVAGSLLCVVSTGELVCVCVLVSSVSLCLCVCVCVWKREKGEAHAYFLPPSCVVLLLFFKCPMYEAA